MNRFAATTRSGRWSVHLNAVFVGVVALSLTLAPGLKVLSFGDRWWDITVPALVLMSLSALVLGVRALRKNDRAVSVVLSVALCVLTVLFILLHSLFISD